MKVDVIIAGAQKCGTTALHSFLSAHPKVIGSDPKELDFFNYDKRYAKGLNFYHQNFSKRPFLYQRRGFKFLEASPSYIADQDVQLTAKRILEYNEDVKIISLVRNPIKRALSAWNMYRERYERGNVNWWVDWVNSRSSEKIEIKNRNPIGYKNFQFFLEEEIQSFDEGKIIECPVLRIGEYYKGIEVFQKAFRDNFMVVKNEDLNTTASFTLTKIADFLELSKFDWQKFEKVKVFKGDYDTKIEPEALVLLEQYYKVPNQILDDLTKIKY